MLADHGTTWRQVRPELERHFTVHAMDRRGRGGSGDGPRYALEREVEDVAAVADAIAEPVFVAGHSLGGLIALEAALHSRWIERVASYEGVFLRGEELVSSDKIARCRDLLAASRTEELLVAFLRDFVQMPERDLAYLRADSSAWKTRLANARTIPRELEAQREYRFDPGRFAGLETPVLLLVGEESPDRERRWADAVASGLPRAGVRLLEGQEHIAMYTAPEAFVAELVLFGDDAPSAKDADPDGEAVTH